MVVANLPRPLLQPSHPARPPHPPSQPPDLTLSPAQPLSTPQTTSNTPPPPSPTPSANLPLSGQTIYLGIWGDADPLNITDWVPVTVDAIPATQTWDVDSQSCVNAVVGFELQILTAKVRDESGGVGMVGMELWCVAFGATPHSHPHCHP